jgi:hypothetical protein
MTQRPQWKRKENPQEDLRKPLETKESTRIPEEPNGKVWKTAGKQTKARRSNRNTEETQWKHKETKRQHTKTKGKLKENEANK